MADGGTPTGGTGGTDAGRARRERLPHGWPADRRPRGNPQGEIGTAWSVPPGGPRPPTVSARITGGVAFAGTLMLCSGFLAFLQGIAAIAEDDIYARVGSYVYGLSLVGWGWIHLVLGVLVAVTGAGLLRGMAPARPPGILLASLSLVTQFLFLPYEPVWSVVVMAIDVLVIRALASWQPRAGRQRRDTADPGSRSRRCHVLRTRW
ncbi:hypothetical protein [Streptomyces sp. NPDC058335]|uniref:DUF7144 family membrane protein n=1 Tax=Streptomyces sp. NPDC058335 TaxID=3346451 RepID=UPI003664A131